MKLRSLHLIAFLQALGVAIYITSLVGLVNLADFIGLKIPHPQFVAPIMMLLTLVISAAITGSLVLGYAITLFLSGKKREAITLFLETVAFLIGFVCLILIVSIR